MTKDRKKIQFRTDIGVLEHLKGMHYLRIPAKILQDLGGGFNRRLKVTVNGSLQFQGGLMALGEGDAYITISSARMKKLGVSLGNTVDVQLEDDTSQFGMEVPDALEALLAQDEEGKRRFLGLTPGKQRYIIQYVASVKSTEKRIERSLLLIGNLKKLPEGKESFREMLGLPRDRE